MRSIFYIVGIAIIVFTIVDLVWTTLWVDGGAGPLSKRVAETLWKVFDKLGKKNSKFYDFTGPITLVSTLLSWSLLIWIGFALFLMAMSIRLLIVPARTLQFFGMSAFILLGLLCLR